MEILLWLWFSTTNGEARDASTLRVTSSHSRPMPFSASMRRAAMEAVGRR
jgi:hypothetical protein